MNSRRSLSRTLLLVSLLLVSSCLGKKQVQVDTAGAELSEPKPGQFPYELIDQVQSAYVDDQGLVDYDGLDANDAALRKYVGYLQKYSPKSHPHLFPTREDKLAYYINAYNAFVLFGVIENYPGIASVNDVTAGGIKLKDGQGFFYSTKFTMGGESINLYDLENKVIRPMNEPRIHFAINCASMGCPQLPNHAFHPATLDAELEVEARKFFSEKRNVLVNDAAKTVTLSKIQDWFADDFTTYVGTKAGKPKEQASVLEYVAMYADPATKAAVEKAIAEGYKVEFREYGWELNKKGAQRAAVS